MIDEKASIFLTGGTGSFGNAIVASMLNRYPSIRRLVVFSRDEVKQFDMAERFSPSDFPGLRYVLGDVRDADRMRRVMGDIDVVIHAAALKQVSAAERNPFEAIQTNVIGAQNVIECALDSGVKRVIALSTDKAAAPVNLYGATKLCSDKLFTAANRSFQPRDTRFSVVRYGNVMGSRGSVIPLFLRQRETGILPITDPRMTRFNISLREAVDMVWWAVENSEGGELFVPKIPSYRVSDLAEAIAPNCKKRVVGIRAGEKIHEEMITASDSYNTVDLGKYFAILPAAGYADVDEYCRTNGCQMVEPGFAYSSATNDRFLSVKELRDLIRENIDPAFHPIVYPLCSTRGQIRPRD